MSTQPQLNVLPHAYGLIYEAYGLSYNYFLSNLDFMPNLHFIFTVDCTDEMYRSCQCHCNSIAWSISLTIVENEAGGGRALSRQLCRKSLLKSSKF